MIRFSQASASNRGKAVGSDMKPSDALAAHRGGLRDLVGRHGLTRARVFGSVTDGTDTEESDLDLLVDPGHDQPVNPRGLQDRRENAA